MRQAVQSDPGAGDAFGETAVRLGYATSEDVQRAIEEQKVRRARGERPALLGTLMVDMGLITP
jgi:hypothetical protein